MKHVQGVGTGREYESILSEIRQFFKDELCRSYLPGVLRDGSNPESWPRSTLVTLRGYSQLEHLILVYEREAGEDNHISNEWLE